MRPILTESKGGRVNEYESRFLYLSTLSSYLQSQEWDIFFTATFARKANYPRLAIDRVTRVLCFAEQFFIGSETHKLGGYHSHGIVRFTRMVGLDDAAGSFQDKLRRMGYSKVEPVRSRLSVCSYCTKYVTKSLADYDFGGKAWRPWA